MRIQSIKNNWINKSAFAQMMRVSEKSVENWIRQCNPDFVAANIKKGGYHNREIFFTDALVKKLQWIAMKNQANQGPAGTGKMNTENVFGIQGPAGTGRTISDIAVESPVKKATEEAVKTTLSMKIIMESGDVDAMKEFCEVAIKATQAVAAEKRAALLQFDNARLANDNEAQRKRIAIDEAQLDFLTRRQPYVYGQLREEV